MSFKNIENVIKPVSNPHKQNCIIFVKFLGRKCFSVHCQTKLRKCNKTVSNLIYILLEFREKESVCFYSPIYWSVIYKIPICLCHLFDSPGSKQRMHLNKTISERAAKIIAHTFHSQDKLHYH